MNWWPLSETEDIVSDNMVLFAYWIGSYQLDNGLSIIESFGSERQLSIAPMTVRGDESLIPADMRILLVSKLYEYGFICRNSAYDKSEVKRFITETRQPHDTGRRADR